jgi:hypothetical protein
MSQQSRFAKVLAEVATARGDAAVTAVRGWATDRVFGKKAPRARYDLLPEDAALFPDGVPPRVELVVQPNEQVRQAGATTAEDSWVTSFRTKAERHLYVFAKVVLGYEFFTTFHKELCQEVQTPRPEPWRVLILAPRESGKSTIVGRSWPLHVVIQPKDHNIYFPNERGLDQRIFLAGETELRAMSHLSVIQAHADGNQLLRALWPECFWRTPPKRDWNAKALTFPYPYGPRPWPDPTIWASGVGGATTGTHPSALAKDDIATWEAANSPVVMQSALDWHVASRALIGKPGCIELNISTRWTIYDVNAYIIENDPSVHVVTRAVIEEGHIIWPEHFDPNGDGGTIDRLRKEMGILFNLLYMNSAANPDLTDFQESDLRTFAIENGELRFTEDGRDLALAEMMNSPGPMPDAESLYGMPLTAETYETLRKTVGRYAALRLRA